jgi:transcriptional regulator with XRE-family HTH domain
VSARGVNVFLSETDMKAVREEAVIFGAALKRLREERGLSQDGLAKLAGIGSSYASHLERGEQVPRLTIIIKLALALDVTLAELLADFTKRAMKRLRLDD